MIVIEPAVSFTLALTKGTTVFHTRFEPQGDEVQITLYTGRVPTRKFWVSIEEARRRYDRLLKAGYKAR